MSTAPQYTMSTAMSCDINPAQLTQDLMLHTCLAYYPTVYVGLFDNQKMLYYIRYTSANINQPVAIDAHRISCAAYFSIAVKNHKSGAPLREIWRISVNRCEALCGAGFTAAEVDKKHEDTDTGCLNAPMYNMAAFDVQYGCHSEGLFICACRANHTCYAPAGYYRKSKAQYLQLMTTHRLVCPERPKCSTYYAASMCLKSLTK
jgi:hypothetical protein